MSKALLDRFFEIERNTYGKADYFFKKDTRASRIRAFYVRPFSPDYLQDYTTTLGSDTYFASGLAGDWNHCLEVEYHENIHKWDHWHQGFKFVLKYAWPHWMLLPFLLAVLLLSGWRSILVFVGVLAALHVGLFILSVAGTGLRGRVARVFFYLIALLGLTASVTSTAYYGGGWALLWIGVLLFASPWPIKPFWRRDYELRGYTMSLYYTWLACEGAIDAATFERRIEHYVKHFSGPAYLFMETDEDWVREEFRFQVKRLRFDEAGFLTRWLWRCRKSDSIVEAEPFRMAARFIKRGATSD